MGRWEGALNSTTDKQELKCYTSLEAWVTPWRETLEHNSLTFIDTSLTHINRLT